MRKFVVTPYIRRVLPFLLALAWPALVFGAQCSNIPQPPSGKILLQRVVTCGGAPVTSEGSQQYSLAGKFVCLPGQQLVAVGTRTIYQMWGQTAPIGNATTNSITSSASFGFNYSGHAPAYNIHFTTGGSVVVPYSLPGNPCSLGGLSGSCPCSTPDAGCVPPTVVVVCPQTQFTTTQVCNTGLSIANLSVPPSDPYPLFAVDWGGWAGTFTEGCSLGCGGIGVFGYMGGSMYGEITYYYWANDCNGNGSDDSTELTMLNDMDGNGIYDACEVAQFGAFCFGDGTAPDAKGNLVSCPCASVSAGDRGCPNSSNVQGARLRALGQSQPDQIHLVAEGLPFNAYCLFIQGSSAPGASRIGDGISCVGGSVSRLSVKLASQGVAVYPQPGDIGIREQSLALGDPIGPASSRVYQVYYREPNPTFCPQGGTFNLSSAVLVQWP